MPTREWHFMTNAVLKHQYRVSRPDGRTLHAEKWISRDRAARLIAIGRELGTPFQVEHKATYVEYETHICRGCQARPALWERGRNSKYLTVQCGQCDWWACWRERHPK